MQAKKAKFAENSIAGLLLAMATVLFIGSKAEVDFILPHDLIFGISIRYLCWIGGSATLVASLLVLIDFRSPLPLALSAWIAATFLVYQCLLYGQGGGGLTGCLDGLSHAFGVSAKTANELSLGVAAYLLMASVVLLFWQWRSQKQEKQFLKIFCPDCGGHVKFIQEREGEQIDCPHCAKSIKLRRPESLKVNCFFCEGHIEFPSHALGTKIPCPHCKMDITLKEVA
ncbi:MAG: hypothetical protein P4N60_06800 [Verrucomicrobiae bacterium]|nr:hypothetical protein [Verrucomicrobiae bacterium]